MAQQRLPHEVGVLGHAGLDVDLGVGIRAAVTRHGLEVGARGEVALGAGEDDAAHAVIRRRLQEGVVHAHERRP